jgi:hypothetical protein
VRIKRLEDVTCLGQSARIQVEKALKVQGTRRTHLAGVPRPKSDSSTTKNTCPTTIKKQKLARVMKDPISTLKYCPFPSPDPVVKIHNLLSKRFGEYHTGGVLLTEMIIKGGEKEWRFDFVILPWNEDDPISLPATKRVALIIEMDGFAYHRSLTAFKNDRAKQRHALMSGFVLHRITHEDIRLRFSDIVSDIESMLEHQRIYPQKLGIIKKGVTQSIFSWS